MQLRGQLHGKELSYNLLDLESALSLAQEFDEPAAVLIKHTNPAELQRASSSLTPFCATRSRSVSAFGCVMALNRPVDEATARAITDPGRFVEAIIAPSFAGPALDLLTTRPSWKANVRLIEVGDLGLSATVDGTIGE